jgi:assimilatory nitrate reductase catalytic subunit
MNTGRVRDHWHSLTRTGKAPRLSRHIVEPFASINPETSRQLNIADNDLVHIKSAKGHITVRAQVSDSIRQDEVFVPFHWNDQFASAARVDSLVFPETDPVSGQPEFKATPVCIERSNFQWHGFLMTRDVIDYPQTNYWAKAREDKFWRYELAGDTAKTDWSQQLHEILGDETEHLDRIEYTDHSADRYRSAWFNSGKLQGCFFSAPDYNALPSRDWLLTQFNTNSFDQQQRLQVLAGHPADPSADTGPVVCCCFNIGKNTLINAIQEKALSNVEAIGQCLKAGTNCGSCIPELKALLNDVLQQP